jgi:hypothetical protein
MVEIHEMRAYRNEKDFDRVGFILLDEDDDGPVENIYEDPRITTACGSNWTLYNTCVEADEHWRRNTYYVGDWKEDNANRWPECYLHVLECRSGQEWIKPITGKTTLNLKLRVKQWAKEEFGGELRLDGEIMPKLEGDYYVQILTDYDSPHGHKCWTGGGFWLKGYEE